MKLSIFTLALTTVSALSKGKPLVESTPCKHEADSKKLTEAYSQGFKKGFGFGKATGKGKGYKIGYAIGNKEGRKACEQTSEARERRFWVRMTSICEPQLRTEWKIYKIFILGYFGWLGCPNDLQIH